MCFKGNQKPDLCILLPGKILSPMRRFLASGWFPLLLCLVMAGTALGAYAVLKPTGADINQSQILEAMKIAGWVTGPAIGLFSLILIGILNVVRRMVRLRHSAILHPIVVLLGILPWLILGWQLTGEPPFTPLARGVVPFIARPMLWGAMVATLLTILLSLPALASKPRP